MNIVEYECPNVCLKKNILIADVGINLDLNYIVV